MIEFTYTITDPMGLHARPVGLLARLLSMKGLEAKILFTGKILRKKNVSSFSLKC